MPWCEPPVERFPIPSRRDLEVISDESLAERVSDLRRAQTHIMDRYVAWGKELRRLRDRVKTLEARQASRLSSYTRLMDVEQVYKKEKQKRDEETRRRRWVEEREHRRARARMNGRW